MNLYFAGAKVSDTIRKGVITVDLYQNETMLLMTGNIAALSGRSNVMDWSSTVVLLNGGHSRKYYTVDVYFRDFFLVFGQV